MRSRFIKLPEIVPLVLSAVLILGAALVSTETQAFFYHRAALPRSEGIFEKNNNLNKDLFLKNCARCHGADGKAETEIGRLYGAKDLTARTVKQMSDKNISGIILSGKGSMPAFKKKLSKQDVSSLVNYIRSL